MVIISDIQLPKDADGILKVSDVSTSSASDLSARTDIANPSTSTFIKTDAVGRLNILESNIEGAGPSNSLNSTEYPVHQIGAFDGNGYRVAKCSNVGRLEVDINSGGGGGDASAANQTNGNQKTQIFGIDPSNNQVQLSVENGGKAQVQVVGSNDINGGLPHRHLTIDANGRTLTNPLMTATNTAINNMSAKITQGADATLSNAQQVLCYGKDQSGNLDALNVDNNGHLKITLNDIEAGIVNSINVASKHDNAYLQLMTNNSTITNGVSEKTTAHTLSAGAGVISGKQTITIYVHFGSGTTDSNFTVEVEKSYDGTHYFLDSNFTFNPVGFDTQNPPVSQPAVVGNGFSDGRFLKVKITNNGETNPVSVNVYIIERQ